LNSSVYKALSDTETTIIIDERQGGINKTKGSITVKEKHLISTKNSLKKEEHQISL
jgi:hypothetical protein